MSASSLGMSVAAKLEGHSDQPALEWALDRVRGELSIDRLSLHAIAQGTFRVLASSGDELLASGTELPIEVSSQIEGPAAGRVFRGPDFAQDAGFDRPLDRLVLELGFSSGCSLPLRVGNRAVGVLAVTARSDELPCDAVLAALESVSSPITLALLGPQSTPPPEVLVCDDDELVAGGIARVLEQALGANAHICTDPNDIYGEPPRGIDVIVCDSFFGDGRLHRFLRELRALGTSAPTLVLASADSPLSRNLARLAGAAAYAVRQADGSTAIVEAVRRLIAGDPPGLPSLPSQTELHLTPQEARVLLALERGLRFKQIALELSITEATAKGYARGLFGKLDAHSRSEAVYQARRLGLLDFLRTGAREAPVVTGAN
jgi:two-component system nitrate/nitrite response regulator NarL